MHWLCLHLPDLALEVFSRGGAIPRAVPLAVSDGASRRPRIVACNAAAGARGVRPGMEAGAARALAQGLVLRVRDAAAERRALERLAQWAGRFTPRVSPAPPREVLLEVEGSASLFGGVSVLRAQVCAGVARLGHRVHTALAPTPLGASLLARAGEEREAPDLAALRTQLAGLPPALLEMPPEVCTTLEGLGVRSLGECLRLPRAGLARRAAPVLAALDRALGIAPDPRPAFVPPPQFEDRLDLPAEVERADALAFAARRLLGDLAAVLAGRQAGVESLELRLLPRRGAPTAVRIGFAAPTRAPARLAEPVRLRLDTLKLTAPVAALVLRAGRIVPLPPDHAGGWFGTGAPPAAAALLDRLRARLQEDSVQGLGLTEDHRPERAYRTCPPGATVGGTPPPPLRSARPLWLLPRPLPLEARGGRPCYGGTLALAPERERIESGWWDGADAVRDYFVARTPNGMRLWIFRVPGAGGRWFLHGFFE